MRSVFTGVLLASAAVSGQSLAVSVMEAQGLSEASVKRVHKASLEQLKAVAALTPSDAYDWKGPKRTCSQSDLACQRDKVKASGAPAAVALWLQGTKDSFTATVTFWLDGERVASLREGDVTFDALDVGLRPLLEAVVPPWMRKGWGGVRLSQEPPPGSVLKLDGRVLSGKRSDVVPVTAGAHQLDVVFPGGRAVLQRIDVVEGSRTRVEVSPPAGVASSAGGFSGLRIASYAAWMVGAATLLSAFIVGFVGRQTANGQSPCRPDSRECVTLAEAMEQQRAAAGYASTANVLFGTGLAFALAGAGLFTFDLLR